MTDRFKPPRHREVKCTKCGHIFKSCLLSIAYCPKCRHPNKLEPGFSPNQ